MSSCQRLWAAWSVFQRSRGHHVTDKDVIFSPGPQSHGGKITSIFLIGFGVFVLCWCEMTGSHSVSVQPSLSTVGWQISIGYGKKWTISTNWRRGLWGSELASQHTAGSKDSNFCTRTSQICAYVPSDFSGVTVTNTTRHVQLCIRNTNFEPLCVPVEFLNSLSPSGIPDQKQVPTALSIMAPEWW